MTVLSVDSDATQPGFIESLCQPVDMLETAIFYLESKIKHFRKEISPSINCIINDKPIVCIVDEGSEINCCSFDFAKNVGLPIVDVSCSAVGANKSSLNIIGVVNKDVIAKVIGTKSLSYNRIASLIVVQNLGTDVLLGQPKKIDNEMITYPHKSILC